MSWRRFFQRSAWDDERAREIEAHLQIEIDEQIARGLSPDDARRAALRLMGNRALARERIYDFNTIGWLETLWQDARYGLRLLRRTPTFAAVAIVSLALGIGANTAIFQLLDVVRMRALPVADPQALIELRIDNATSRTGRFTSRHPMLTNALWEGLRDDHPGLTSVMAWASTGFDLSTSGESRIVRGVYAGGDYFTTLGVQPAVGRLFGASDDVRGCAAPDVVLSDAFWRHDYGADPQAIGRTIRLDGHSLAIAGVTPPGFFGVEVGRTFDVAVPLCAEALFSGGQSALDQRHAWWLGVIGRLAPGANVDQITTAMHARSARLFQTTLPPNYAASDAAHYLAFTLGAFPVAHGVSDVRRAYEAPLWLLLTIAGLVLIIACGNLANLMLARASARSREIGVRLALGASRARLIRQFLIESLMVALIGAAAGTAIAAALSRALVALLSTPDSPIAVTLDLDWRVLAFTAALALVTTVLFGLVPALRGTHASPGAVMKRAGRGLTDSREKFALRRALVVGQIALSLVLVVGALLFVRTLHNLVTLDPGLRIDGVLVADLDLRRVPVPASGLPALQTRLRERVGAIPGAGVASADIIPISGNGWNETLLIAGRAMPHFPNVNRVSANFFHLLGMTTIEGRVFDGSDALSSPPVAVVSQAFVRENLPGGSPLGRAFEFQLGPHDPRVIYTVVGIVTDAKYSDLREPIGPVVYLADTQQPEPGPHLTLLVRGAATSSGTRSAAGMAPGLSPAIVAAVRDISPDVVMQIGSLEDYARSQLLRERLLATLAGFFGALAGLIAAVGLYGVMSYAVVRRRQEIGVRLALGASRARVLRMIAREAVVLVAIGLGIGVGLAMLAGRSVAAFLFDLTPTDPLTFAIAAALLAGVAAVASAVPASRAARVMPTVALRED